MAIRLLEKIPDKRTFLVVATLIVAVVLWYVRKYDIQIPLISNEMAATDPGLLNKTTTYEEKTAPILPVSEDNLDPRFPRNFIRGTDIVVLSSNVTFGDSEMQKPVERSATYTTSQTPQVALAAFKKYFSDMKYEVMQDRQEGERIILPFRINVVDGEVSFEANAAGALIEVILLTAVNRSTQ